MARIGIDARYLENENTGVGRYSYNLIKELLGQDRENRYAIFVREAYAGPLPDADNVEYVRVPYAPIGLGSLLAMSRRVRSIGVDLWHAHFPVAPLSCATPLVVTVHDLQPLRVKALGARRPLPLRIGYRIYYPSVYGYTLVRARAILAVSLSTCNEIQDYFRIPRERIHVIHEALDPRFCHHDGPGQTVEPDKSRQGLPDRFLLYVGATLPHKNLVNMLRGFARALRDMQRKDLFLVMAGRESRFEREWIDLAGRLGIASNIRRIGYVSQEDLPSLYRNATALLYVSRYEGFGFPPLEAMQSGCPVIASTHGALPEVVRGAGILVHPEDVEGIADAIRRVLRHPDLRRRLRHMGKKNLSRFSWQRAARKTLAVYRSVLQESRAGPPGKNRRLPER